MIVVSVRYLINRKLSTTLRLGVSLADRHDMPGWDDLLLKPDGVQDCREPR